MYVAHNRSNSTLPARMASDTRECHGNKTTPPKNLTEKCCVHVQTKGFIIIMAHHQNWIAEPCPTAAEAMRRVSESGGGGRCCTNISMEIKADNGRAWRHPRNYRLRKRDFRSAENGPNSIYCQGNLTHVWKNLEERFGKGSAARIQAKNICYGKQAIYLIKNTRTDNGHYIIIGKIHNTCVIWSQFKSTSDVPEDLMNDILALVAHLWTGEKWGGTPENLARKSNRKRSSPTAKEGPH